MHRDEYLNKTSTKLIAVIIVNWNALSVIGRCIESIFYNFQNLNYEIFVVDNNSTDGSTSYIKKNYPAINLIECERNLGFAAANNLAVNRTNAETIFIVNPDTELKTDAVLFIRNLELPNVAGCFGRLKYPNGEYQTFIRNFPTIANQIGELFFIPHFFPKAHYFCEMVKATDKQFYSKSRYIQSGSGAFFCIKKNVFLEFGGFDEDFFVYGEETDLFYKMRKKGYSLFYDPKIEILHHHGKSTKQNPAMYFMLQKNKFIFLKKNYGKYPAICYRFLFLIPYDLSRGFFKCIFSLFKSRSLIYQAKLHFQSAWKMMKSINN